MVIAPSAEQVPVQDAHPQPTDSPDARSQTMVNPGSIVAALWIRASQDAQPPASIPASVIPVLLCPQCQQQLDSTLNASGLQNCLSCGWIG